MLQVSSLTCVRDRRRLFSAVSFSLSAGELLQVVGGNGTGKSTLLRILVGLFTDFEGEVSWDLNQAPLYLGHRPGVKTGLTVLENLRWPVVLRGGDAGRIEEALGALGLSGFEDTPASQLSEGQRKRVGLAQFLLVDNPCWIMDEPFSAIDAEGLGFLRSCMEKHVDAGGAVLFSSHQDMGVDRPLRTVALG